MPFSTATGSSIEPFAAPHVSQVNAVQPQNRWLIEPLWFAGGVGVLGGHPKTCKTQLAAEMSIAVASGQAALGHLPTLLKGPVLFYGAEDALPLLRNRFEQLARARGLSLDQLPLFLLDVPVLRLDRHKDLQRLRAAVETISPRLLVLDPLVRIARLDENSAADVSALLGSLRAMQRDYDLAIILVHHARKSPASHPGQALRGSSDIAAWSDTNLYLFRKNHRLTLQVEHRFAAPPPPLQLQLRTEPSVHLAITDADTQNDTDDNSLDKLQKELLDLLSQDRPLSTVALRSLLRRRKQLVVEALKNLADQDLVSRSAAGWTLNPPDQQSLPVPCSLPKEIRTREQPPSFNQP